MSSESAFLISVAQGHWSVKSKMDATEQVFVYNCGSSRARYSNFVSIPPEIDISDTPDRSMLWFDVVLDYLFNMAAHP